MILCNASKEIMYFFYVKVSRGWQKKGGNSLVRKQTHSDIQDCFLKAVCAGKTTQHSLVKLVENLVVISL